MLPGRPIRLEIHGVPSPETAIHSTMLLIIPRESLLLSYPRKARRPPSLRELVFTSLSFTRPAKTYTALLRLCEQTTSELSSLQQPSPTNRKRNGSQGCKHHTQMCMSRTRIRHPQSHRRMLNNLGMQATLQWQIRLTRERRKLVKVRRAHLR